MKVVIKQFASPYFALPAGKFKSNFVKNLSGDDARCHYCGRMTFDHRTFQARQNPKATRTVDHVKPIAAGGTNDLCVVACTVCNGLKAHLPYDVFRAWMSLPDSDSWNANANFKWAHFVHDCALAGFRAGRQLAQWTKDDAEREREIARHRDAVSEAYERFRASRMRRAA